ncbi:MAG: hypothetical protein GMKNLPBB_02496 [Myxococcota bacterium]|nr:hypothetical protein [Myxococcota bacterium]
MEAQVIEPIPGHGRKGAAKVDGEVWSAEMEDHGPANAGEVLHIARADGATLTLRRDSSAERGQTRGQP